MAEGKGDGKAKDAGDAADARANKLTNTQILCTLLRTLSAMTLIPVQPKIIQHLAESDEHWSYSSYSSTVQFSGALVQLTLLPYAGALSDRLLGRKPPLLLCGSVQLLYMTALKLAEQGQISLTLLVVLAVFNVASSYIAMAITSAALGDVWSHKPGKLAGASGKLGGIAFGVGMLFGPGLGSVISAKAGGPQTTLGVAMGMSCCAIMAQAFFAEETAQSAKGGTVGSLREALVGVNPLAGLKLIFLAGGPQLRALGTVALIHGFTKGEQAMYMPFMLQRWKLESSGIAKAMTVVGLAVAVSQAVLAKPLVARFGARGALVRSLAAATLQRSLWSVFTTPAAMGGALVLGSPGLTADAFMRQMASEYWRAPPAAGAASGADEAKSKAPPQGEISAALTAVSTLAVLLSSPVIGKLFSAGNDSGFPGLPFLFGACCCGTSLLFLIFATSGGQQASPVKKDK